MFNHHYATGAVWEVDAQTGQLLIGLRDYRSILLQTTPPPKNFDTRLFEKNPLVVVSWVSKQLFPKAFHKSYRQVDFDGVEILGHWHLEYSANYPEHRDKNLAGFAFENLMIQALRKCGIRAERSSPFQDQEHKVDLWLRVKLTPLHPWRWYPISLRLGNPDNGDWEAKYWDGLLHHRVLPISMAESEARLEPYRFLSIFHQRFMKPLNTLTERNMSLLTRTQANFLEEAYALKIRPRN